MHQHSILRGIFLAAACLICTATLTAKAAERHWLPQGAGRMDSSAWDHAMSHSALKGLTNDLLKPGDRLLIGSGEFADVALRIACSGTEAAPTVITGVDRGAGLPQFVSRWQITAPDKGPSAIVITEGVQHITVSDLRIKGYQIGV